MESDRELLELAARAAGVSKPVEPHGGFVQQDGGFCFYLDCEGKTSRTWNPLTDDGDALRLAVKLNIPVYPYDDETSTGTAGVVARKWGSKEANTRRAIVRAAAAIARSQHE